ncbi:three-Cys-motif partner protein TcmP [Microbacterium sp. C23T]
MATTQTIWPIEPHTAAKHQLLAQYLDAWFPILATHNKRVVFFDGFAGPGVYAGGEPGSPEIALSHLLDHAAFNQMSGTDFVFIFNEQDRERHASLCGRVDVLKEARSPWPPNVRVHVVRESFPVLAEKMLKDLGDKVMAPTFAFLDPFGYRDVPIDLVRRLVQFPRSELFIYWDFNSMNRFSTAGIVDEHFTQLFGCEEYKQAPKAGDPTRKSFLHDLYQRQLRTVCGLPYVQSFEMVNADNRTGYYLFFCTRNLTAFDKMKSVMWKVDPMGGNRFSDVLAGQTVLFQSDVDTEPLKHALLERFRGQTVGIHEVWSYVVGETPYVSGHLKLKTLKPMQQAGLVSSPNQKRAGQFPEGTLVTFAG